MKRSVTAIFIFCFIILSLAGCGKSKAVKNTEKLISSIGEVKIDSGDAIAAAEKQYKLLTEEEKEKVKNYQTLLDAREKLTLLTDMDKQTAELLKKLNKVFDSCDTSAKEISEAYKLLSEQYAVLSDGEKAQIKDFAALEAAVAEYNKTSGDITAPAAAYVGAFYKWFKAGEKPEVTDIGCIVQKRDGKKQTLFALTYRDAGGKSVNVYSAARFSSIPPEETILKYADSFFRSSPLSEKMDALKNGNISVDVNAVLAAVK